MQCTGLWVKVPSVRRGAACTSAYVRVLLCSPSPGPGRCCWCGCGAVEQPSLWQFQAEDSINSLPLSRSISSFLVSEGFLLQKSRAQLCVSIQPFIFHAVEDYEYQKKDLSQFASQVLASETMTIKRNAISKMGVSHQCYFKTKTNLLNYIQEQCTSQMLLVGDFPGNVNKLTFSTSPNSFSVFIVTAMVNDVEKVWIKACNFTGFSHVLDLCDSHIPLCSQTLFVQDQRSVQQQEALTGCPGLQYAGPFCRTMRKVRESFLALFSSSPGSPLETLCHQNNRVTQAIPDWCRSLTHGLTSCQKALLFRVDAPGWIWLIGFVLPVWYFADFSAGDQSPARFSVMIWSRQKSF